MQVQCDYSPGVCSEGGTGVVVAKAEGQITITIWTKLLMYTNTHLFLRIIHC